MKDNGSIRSEGNPRASAAQSSMEPALTRLAFVVAVTSAVAAMGLLPLVLSKPGRIMTNATGELIINPISFRGLGVLFAADVAAVIGFHLARTIFRPRA